MVRLVFRPFTQVRRSICTLESRRTSTRVSPGFALLRQSSPSFGSRHVCSHSNLSPERSWSVDSAISFLSYGVHVNYALGGQPRALAHMSDSLVRVSRRVVKRHFVRVPPTHGGSISPSLAWHLSHAFKEAWLANLHYTAPIGTISLQIRQHCLPTVPFQQFQVLLTLFSKFFSSFPHGTCSLSVSHQYLALDGIYHPLRAAIPNNSTRRRSVVRLFSRHERGSHPPRHYIRSRLCPPSFLTWPLQTTTPEGFSVWALPASLAVTKGILVSFFSSA